MEPARVTHPKANPHPEMLQLSSVGNRHVNARLELECKGCASEGAEAWRVLPLTFPEEVGWIKK